MRASSKSKAKKTTKKRTTPKKVKPMGNVLLSGWNWEVEGDSSVLNFGKGVRIKKLIKERGSNNLSILVSAVGVAQGTEKLDVWSAGRKYPFLF